MDESLNTIFKMSPLVGMAAGINIVIFILKKFGVPSKYFHLIAVALGMVLTPLLVPRSAIAYDVPHPLTALLLAGALLGFVAIGFHQKFKSLLEKIGANTNGDTEPNVRTDISIAFLIGFSFLLSGCAFQRAVETPEGKTTYVGISWFNRTAIAGLTVGKRSGASSTTLSLENGNTETQAEAIKAAGEALGQGIAAGIKKGI